MWDRNLVCCVTKSILTLETRQWWMVGYWCDSVVSKTHNVTKIFLKLSFKYYNQSLQFYEEFCTHSINTYTSLSWQNEIHTYNVYFCTIQMNKTPKLNLSWIKVVVSELLDNLFWNNMPGQPMKMRCSIKFQTWLGYNTQRSQRNLS